MINNFPDYQRSIGRVVAIAAGVLLLLVHEGSGAEARYPNKPIRWIVPFAAGSLLDIRARFIAQRLPETLNQHVVIDNRPGAGGVIGTQLAALAVPDGYTIALGTITTLAIDPALYTKLPYDALRDFIPVILVASGPLVVIVNPAMPVANVRELIALARGKPGQITYGSIGNGSSQHIGVELFKHLTGTDMRHIPYKETAAAVADLLAGRIDMMFESQPAVEQHIKSGRLRALAVTERTRSVGLPELPTLAEAGVDGYEYSGWNGVVAPARTPHEIVDQLHDAMAHVLAQKETQDNFRFTGSRPGGGSMSEFSAHIRAENQKWAEVIRTAGIHLD